ncbi:SDR family oxidoreductase [Alphaproteobacteria bacterium KMM 3653]|uniref:SDR family oxidoreductase n=1 Tax=Harenicola maris TaxID=2841044 RepID=A0AAP2CPS2_9RHOB|nr:SDR family oxidoreductase [Harenicola maris]
MQTQCLNAKHALVTGGGTGIGLAVAQTLAAAGASVTITGRRMEVLERAAQDTPGLHPAQMDVTEPDQVTQTVETAEKHRGPISICIANAGIAEGNKLGQTDLAFWRRIMATNLDGAFLTLQACLPGMKECGWGRGIAISSIAGVKGLKGASAYTASKHGVTGLMRGLAADFIGRNMTFNALCPAYVDTDIIPQNITRIMARTGMDEPAARAVMEGANPHGRLIAPSEVAATALWLCSPGSESINGQAIEIAGGEM